ncbi:MAG: efflux RND transporter periplasmic adaptor subunit [Balneolaceae bacterium]|nr:MAG: efflux RND transporter periplasmic adaptor subunit [Balneolaceae bacterium]
MYKNYSLLLLSLLFAVFVSCSNEGSNQNNNTGQVLPAVEAVQAQFGGLPLEERLSGVVSAGNQVEIYPRITAPIEEVYAETGQRVEKGDVLVRLRDNEFRERLRQAEASLRINLAQQRQARAALGEIESQLRRQQILEERDLTSELEMERIRAQLESAEASLELAMAQVEQAESNVEEQKDALDQTLIRAPISGTVGLRAAEIGMQANTNSRLFMIGDLTRSKISVNLTERMMRYITAGQTVRIFSENLGDTVLTGEISRISPFLGAGSFSTEAEIDVGNESRFLMPGMFVNIDVLYGESEQATIIPLSSIYRHPQTGETGVFVAVNFGMEAEMLEDLEGNQLSNPTDVEFIPIDVIARGREAAGVAGIRSGQWVVTVGQNLLIRDQSGIARVRPVAWDKILDMQRMRPQDLLREIMNGDATQGSASNL